MNMDVIFRPQCFVDLSKSDFVITLDDVDRRKRLETQCEQLQEFEMRHRAEGRARGHAVVFRGGGLCWGWLDVRDPLEAALSKAL
jgi:hypothetical protein